MRETDYQHSRHRRPARERPEHKGDRFRSDTDTSAEPLRPLDRPREQDISERGRTLSITDTKGRPMSAAFKKSGPAPYPAQCAPSDLSECQTDTDGSPHHHASVVRPQLYPHPHPARSFVYLSLFGFSVHVLLSEVPCCEFPPDCDSPAALTNTPSPWKRRFPALSPVFHGTARVTDRVAAIQLLPLYSA
ncbi:hypothetical protein COCON_G00208230 [Conger conger]|uniref:Uncharacterized protein n=1 Tax=Conger conger TaxID=82655 RepID=A0A9Q1HQI6_CONCO|nr:hypothetical protein COCON_G00208230 [Conger conger]